MKVSWILVFLLVPSMSQAARGFPDKSCKVLREMEVNMREQAQTAKWASDTDAGANMFCGGNIPYEGDPATLGAYWLKCADTLAQLQHDNCNLP